MNISIKNVPEKIVKRIRERAKHNHRSLQGELLVILEESLAPRRLSMEETFLMIRDSGLRTQADSASYIRDDRNAR